MTAITIATSIAPRNIKLQREAIDSWLNLGFNVISLNSKEEITLLSPEFPGIHFEVASRTALNLAGKHYVFFDDILTVLLKYGSDICGIINSDILLRVDVDFAEQVRNTARTDFLYASRVDVASMADVDNGEIYPYGFDLFFFPRKLAEEYPASQFCIGAPWWDYWAVLVPIARGYIAKELVVSNIFHVIHESRWQAELHGFFANHLFAIARSNDLLNGSQGALIKELFTAYQSSNFYQASLIYLKYFQRQTVAVHFEQGRANHSFMLKQYVTLRNELVEEKIHVHYLSRELECLRLGLGESNSRSGSSLNHNEKTGEDAAFELPFLWKYLKKLFAWVSHCFRCR